jgi:glyoxylase-like metal-dependent hydrolase (beta-lactamase superfamily II)
MPNSPLKYATSASHGIYTVDSGFVRPLFDAVYLVTQRAPSSNRVAIIDSGTKDSLSRILSTLAEIDCGPENVDYLILTHVHLDHAGGAGAIMQACPYAKLVVHPRGVKHMTDPSALRAGAVAVYGEAVIDKDYGQLIPIPEERMIVAQDGMMINLAGRMLTCFDTPGHAKHHICIWDDVSRGIFTGDTFGISYRDFDTEKGAFIFPTTSPIQFDPKAMRSSLKRLMNLKPDYIFPTHYGKLEQVPHLYQKMLDMLTQVEELGESLRNAENRHELLKSGLLNLYIQELRDHDCKLSDSKIDQLLKTDIELNAQGMGVWLG